MVLDLFEEPGSFEVGDDLLPRLEPVEPAIGFGHGVGQMRVAIEDVDHFEVVPAADLEIVEIMRRGDLDRARAFLRVGVFNGDNRDHPADQRQHRVLAEQYVI